MKLIVATDSKNGIAKNGKIPWNCPQDMKFFRTMTIGETLICGRKTFETFRSPLKMRKTVVVSSKTQPIEGVFAQNPNGVVIGGASIYEWAFANNRISEIFVSRISGDYECDQFIKIPPSFVNVGNFVISEGCRVERYSYWPNWDQESKEQLLENINGQLGITSLKGGALVL